MPSSLPVASAMSAMVDRRRPRPWMRSLSQSTSTRISPPRMAAAKSGSSRLSGGEQLRGDDGAQGVGGEIADQAAEPMHVLHRAVGIVASGRQAQGLLHPIIPGLGYVGDAQAAAQQRLLHFVAQDDVQRVGEFVGIDADEAAFHPRGAAQQGVRLPLGRTGGRAEQLALDDGRRELKEGRTAADLHFHQERLALVQRHAAGIANRLTAPDSRQALLVERVAGFVEHGEQRREVVPFVVARGDARIVRLAAAERVVTDVQATALEVEAEGAHQGLAEGGLALGGKRTSGHRGCGLTADRMVDERRQRGAEFSEHRIDPRLREARFVVVQQGVVGRAAQGVGERLRLLAHQRHHGVEAGSHGLPVVALAGPAPRLFATGGGLGQRDHQSLPARREPSANRGG